MLRNTEKSEKALKLFTVHLLSDDGEDKNPAEAKLMSGYVQ